MARVNYLLDPSNKLIEAQLHKMEKLFVETQLPYKFRPNEPDNILRVQEAQFEETVNTMEDQGHFDPKNLSEYSFYHKLLFLQKKLTKMTNTTM